MTNAKGRPRTSFGDQSERTKRIAKIIALLRKQDYTPTELAKETNYPTKSVYRYIEELRVLKLVTLEDNKVKWSENKQVFPSKADHELALAHSQDILGLDGIAQTLSFTEAERIFKKLAFFEENRKIWQKRNDAVFDALGEEYSKEKLYGEVDWNRNQARLLQHIKTGYPEIFVLLEKYKQMAIEYGLKPSLAVLKGKVTYRIVPSKTPVKPVESIGFNDMDDDIPNKLIFDKLERKLTEKEKRDLEDITDFFAGKFMRLIQDVRDRNPLVGHCDGCLKITIKDASIAGHST